MARIQGMDASITRSDNGFFENDNHELTAEMAVSSANSSKIMHPKMNGI